MATTRKNNAGVAPVGRQPAEWLPAYPTPLLWCTLPPAEAGTNLYLGEQRHMCVNNLPRVAPSGGTAGNRTRDLSITNMLLYHYITKSQGIQKLLKTADEVENLIKSQIIHKGSRSLCV